MNYTFYRYSTPLKDKRDKLIEPTSLPVSKCITLCYRRPNVNRCCGFAATPKDKWVHILFQFICLAHLMSLRRVPLVKHVCVTGIESVISRTVEYVLTGWQTVSIAISALIADRLRYTRSETYIYSIWFPTLSVTVSVYLKRSLFEIKTYYLANFSFPKRKSIGLYGHHAVRASGGVRVHACMPLDTWTYEPVERMLRNKRCVCVCVCVEECGRTTWQRAKILCILVLL